jgi:hypothetical protein
VSNEFHRCRLSSATIQGLLLVFAGFAPSFYLRPLIAIPGMLPPAPLYVYIHGTLMTLWYVLFVLQTGLVARGRRNWHRVLGTAGAVLAAAIVPMGWLTTVRSPSRIAALTGLSPNQLIESFSMDQGLVRGLLGLALFAGCVAVALLMRRHVATHGRLMLLAGVAASGAALAPTRMIGAIAGTVLPSWLLAESVVVITAVLTLALYDLRTLRRIHPVTLIVGSLLLFLVPLASAIAATDAGHSWFLGLFPGQNLSS